MLEAEFWHDCWERGRLGFHQSSYNRHMIRFMPQLGLQPGAHVLVPLCGKSLDMLWLLHEGYAVTGIELSRKAVEDFFNENGLDYDVTDRDGIEAWRHGRLQILCADTRRTLRDNRVVGAHSRACEALVICIVRTCGKSTATDDQQQTKPPEI